MGARLAGVDDVLVLTRTEDIKVRQQTISADCDCPQFSRRLVGREPVLKPHRHAAVGGPRHSGFPHTAAPQRDLSWRRPIPVTVFDIDFHDSGNTTMIRSPLAVLAAFLDRLGRYEPAATIAGYAISPLTAMAFPEASTAIAHLREVLGDQTYESLARKGETMTTVEMVTYAFDQIDQARAELKAVS